jgi:hypothetical protein
MFTQGQYEHFISTFARSDMVAEIGDVLIPIWCDDYAFTSPSAQIVEVETGESGASFSYLFDLTLDRNIVACGIPSASKHQRDRSRMAGHPLANSARYDRGHLMANATGGGCDINLVPQLAKVNRVQFRVLERKVLELSRDQMQCFYFVRCLYTNTTQIPAAFEQGVIQPNGKLLYTTHSNL